MTRSLCFSLVACFALTGCGGPTELRVEVLDISVTAPSGWSVEASEFGISKGNAEIKKDGKTYGFISPGVSVPLGGDRKSWPKEGTHTLEHLKAALAPFSPTDEATFEHGFGMRFEKKGKPYFFYVIQLGDRELQCSANDWIAAEDVPAAISVCTSIRP